MKYCKILIAISLLTAMVSRAVADTDGLLVQDQAGKLVTGAVSNDLGQTTIPVRAFSSQFPSTFAWNNPGFHSLGTAPAGVNPLPPDTDLEWDFLPMLVDGLTSNLLYWDGMGSDPSDVAFGALPDPNYSLTLFGKNNQAAAADGSPNFVAGQVIDTTNGGTGLRMHAHRFFFLDDNDGNISTTPVDGVYLIAMQVRMDGFEKSDPFFMVWSTLGIPSTAVDLAAMPWVEQRVDTLVKPLGDFNGDNVWDTSDIDDLVAQIVAGSGDLAYDMDGDGMLSPADVTDPDFGWLTVGGAQNPPATGGDPFLSGDANLDGVVDGQDFIAWNDGKFTSIAQWSAGDFSADGVVDGQDFILWNDNKFMSADQVVVVPEPACSILWLLGGGLLSTFGRRRVRG